MLDHTLAAFTIIISDLQKAFKCVAVLSQLSYLIYAVIAISFGIGNLAVQIILCVLSALALIFYLLFESFEITDDDKFYKKSKTAIRYTKLAVNAVAIGTSVYGLCLVDTTTSNLYLIMTVLSLILWVVKVLLEVSLVFIKSRYKLLLAGIKIDLENAVGPIRDASRKFVKPVKSVLGILDRARGYEPEEEEEPSRFDDDVTEKQRRTLDDRAYELRCERAEKKRAKKEARAREREARKVHKDTEYDRDDSGATV